MSRKLSQIRFDFLKILHQNAYNDLNQHQNLCWLVD